MLTLRCGLVLGLVLGLLAGCGGSSSNRARVTGKVTYNGQPVKAGNIAFIGKSEGAAPSRASLNPDGTYEIVDAGVGDFLVSIETESMNPKQSGPSYAQGVKGAPQMDPSKMQGAGGGPLTAEQKAERYVQIPKKYSDPKNSGLTATIKPGNNSLDFPLKD